MVIDRREEERALTVDWIVRYDNGYYQMARQSGRPPTSKKLKVRRYLNGELHFNYRGKDLEYQELPQRPVPAAKAQAPLPKRNKVYVPPPDHPWRRIAQAEIKRRSVAKQGLEK